MLEGIINSKSKTFLAFCFCFLAGIAFASIIDIKLNFVYLYLSQFIFIAVLIAFWQDKKKRLFIMFLWIFLLGVIRCQLIFPGNIVNYVEQKVSLVGIVSVEPDVRLDGVRYIVKVQSSNFKVQSRKSQDVNGKVYLKSGLYPRYNYGDELKIECKLQKPEPIQTEDNKIFRYDKYLARYSVFITCQNPVIEKNGEGNGNRVMTGILWLKNKLADKINLLWGEPQASFMAGLLYGYRGGLGSLNDLFAKTGVTHIVAVSGYNISIIAEILITICIQLYIPRKKAFWLIVAGVFLFVIFTGASPSVARAGIMGVTVLLAKRIGRLSRIGNTMALAAVLMCIQNPTILIWDAGFQLSFISTMGLVYLSPIIKNPFHALPEMFGLKETLVCTLSAIVATLPLILYQFGRLSIVAPVVNILILWLIPFLMLFGFVAVVLSFIFFPLGQVVAWIAGVGLSYIIEVVKWFGNLSFAAVNFSIPAWLMILGYAGMIILVKYNYLCQKKY